MSVKHQHSGFTLVEILIAIVIFSIGLLGIAGLQVAGMRFTHGSQLRSVAVAQAESMADLMRANDYGVREGYYNFLNEGTAMPTSYPVDCATTVCSSQDRATYDLVTWNHGVDGMPLESNDLLLPEGEGAVCRDSTPNDGNSGDWACDDIGNLYAIKIEWTERTTGREDVINAEDVDEESTETKVFIMSVLTTIDEN